MLCCTTQAHLRSPADPSSRPSVPGDSSRRDSPVSCAGWFCYDDTADHPQCECGTTVHPLDLRRRPSSTSCSQVDGILPLDLSREVAAPSRLDHGSTSVSPSSISTSFCVTPVQARGVSNRFAIGRSVLVRLPNSLCTGEYRVFSVGTFLNSRNAK